MTVLSLIQEILPHVAALNNLIVVKQVRPSSSYGLGGYKEFIIILKNSLAFTDQRDHEMIRVR